MYRKKKLIIISMCIMILFMVVGYAAFSTNLKINGTASIDSTWDIYFESITTKSTTSGAKNKVDPTVSNLSATMNYELDVPGDKIIYEIVLKNNGTLNAVVESINANKGGAPQIIYTISGIKKGDKINANSSRTITVTIEFDSSVTTNPALKETSLKIDLTCVQDTGSITTEDLVVYQPMLMKGAYTSSTIAFLEGPITKGSIESVIFTNSKTVPSGVKGSWDVSANDDGKVMAWYFDADSDNLYEVYIGQDGGVIANTDLNYLFYRCENLAEIDFTYFDTSKTTSMNRMFAHTKVVELDLSKFDTSNVTDMSRMFYNCQNLTRLDVSNFNTSSVTTMYVMFNSCTKLTELDLNHFDTSSVTTMYAMFGDCTSLKELDLSSFDTSKVTNMYAMFSGCASLTKLDLSGFDTSNVIDMSKMFYYCSKLQEISLKNATFNTNLTYTEMFAGALSSVKVLVKSEVEKTWVLDKLPTANVVVV